MASTKFGTIQTLYKDLRQYYLSLNRSEAFFDTLYQKDKLGLFYSKHVFAARNIIVTASIWTLPAYMTGAYLKEHSIFVVIMYFDDIAFYVPKTKCVAYKNRKKYNGLSDKITTSLATETAFLEDVNRAATYDAQENKQNVYFSNMFGMPYFVSQFLNSYGNSYLFNILDTTNRNRTDYCENLKLFHRNLNIK